MAILVVMSLLVAAVMTVFYKHYSARRTKNYPPGPPGLPFIGSLFDIDDERPWITYRKWADIYADDKLCDRPRLVVAQELITQNGWYIGTARTRHDTHRRQRRILAEPLRANALKDWAHPVEIEELHYFLRYLVERPKQFVDAIKCFTVNVMLRTTFDHPLIHDLDDILIRKINMATDHQFTAQIQGRFWVDYFPFFKSLPAWLPGMGWKNQAESWQLDVDNLYGLFWYRTKRSLKDGTARPSLVKSLIEDYKDQVGEPEGRTISSAIVDAGSDTLTATTVIIIIIFMYFPDILRNSQAVVDSTVGNKRLPGFEDLARIPYITALIREASRWRTVAPAAIPHTVVNEDEYNGYAIPKGATVVALSHHIHRDPELYPNPDSFKPERFLDDDGKLNNLPHAGFGFGSRKCLGKHFAEQTLFLLISNLVWAFDIAAPVDSSGKNILPSLDPKDWGAFLASPPPMDFDVIIAPRSGRNISAITERTTYPQDCV